ncbi:MAG: site-specific DNA-methyltransferase [Desulfatirhabdiaceae bacterium]
MIARTPIAPFQKIRSFNSENRFEDGRQNLLIFVDNLLALKTLYDDQQGPDHYKTRNRIKLIYIDPPFATRQDFMKDREKAYRDKIIGAQFIEFLRKRLILMREILADDGNLYLHLDTKKIHYIKSVMDEVFSETNFRNEIIWKRTSAHSDSKIYANVHDTILFYTKSDITVFHSQYSQYSEAHINKRYKYIDEKGRKFADGDLVGAGLKGGGYEYEWKGISKMWRCPIETMRRYETEGRLYYTNNGVARIKRYFDELPGQPVQDVWSDMFPVNSQAAERVNYPTQKPEQLLGRIIQTSSNKNDIVLDAFAGSGTTLAVAEKLGRRWIGMDCGKLAIYTIQKRLLNLTTKIGSGVNDERRDYERVPDFEAHSKSNSRLLFMVYEKAKKGDLLITDKFLQKLAELIEMNLQGNKTEMVSLICPEKKFRIEKLAIVGNEDGKAGEKIIAIGRVQFLISFVQEKEKREKDKPLPAQEFTLFHAGIYDKSRMMNMHWDQYKLFVSQLFGMRIEPHAIFGFMADGYIGVHSAVIWNYPDHKDMVLDRGYVQSLHDVLNGRAGGRFYVIAPVVAMHFMEDEITIGDTTYVFLKVPLSVLKAIIERGETGSLKQPVKEEDVNDVIDAVGFDFISQPVVDALFYRRPSERSGLFDSGSMDFVIEVRTFKSNTLVYDPDDFDNFQTLSMILIDIHYNDRFFNMTHAFWGDTILNADRSKGIITIPESDFQSEKMMIILMDQYGNELKLVKRREDFHATEIPE